MLKWLRNNLLGTYLTTRLRGVLVGEDGAGNRYYRGRGRLFWREERRWVVYAGNGTGEIEASSVTPGWNAWLHHNLEHPPSETPLVTKVWEKPHLPNLTGTKARYLPPGHTMRGGRLPRTTGDYEAWRP